MTRMQTRQSHTFPGAMACYLRHKKPTGMKRALRKDSHCYYSTNLPRREPANPEMAYSRRIVATGVALSRKRSRSEATRGAVNVVLNSDRVASEAHPVGLRDLTLH